jgi:iron complex transport system substrate-binding protein
MENIKGVCNTARIYNPYIADRFAGGRIVDLGDNFTLNIEKLLIAAPQAIMINTYEQGDKYSKLIENSGIPILYNQEWKEETPLGRAEWIKFVAAFYDKDQMADSIFDGIAKRYNEVAEKARNLKRRPSILSGGDFKGTWYVPAGKSFMAQYYRDAGASYFYSADNRTGSLSFSFESVLNNFISANYWFDAPYLTREELKNADTRFMRFQAYRDRQVYNFNKRRSETGSSDFWESAVARPDIVLKDLVKVMHPNLLPGHQLFSIELLK